jgi:hypothetical protein
MPKIFEKFASQILNHQQVTDIFRRAFTKLKQNRLLPGSQHTRHRTGHKSEDIINSLKRSTILVLFLGLSLILGCGSDKKTVKEKQQTSNAESSIAMSSDTTPTPNAQPPPSPPTLPPGQARIKGEIMEIGERADDFIKLKVVQILGYGPATRPLTVSDTLKIAYTRDDQKGIKIGKIVIAVISYRHQLENSESSPLWTLVRFDEEMN